MDEMCKGRAFTSCPRCSYVTFLTEEDLASAGIGRTHRTPLAYSRHVVEELDGVLT
eukprot:gene11885-biopygen7854